MESIDNNTFGKPTSDIGNQAGGKPRSNSAGAAIKRMAGMKQSEMSSSIPWGLLQFSFFVAKSNCLGILDSFDRTLLILSSCLASTSFVQNFLSRVLVFFTKRMPSINSSNDAIVITAFEDLVILPIDR